MVEYAQGLTAPADPLKEDNEAMLIQKDDYGTRFYPFVDGELQGVEGYIYVLTFQDEVQFNVSTSSVTPERWEKLKAAADQAFGYLARRQLLQQFSAEAGRELTNREAEALLERLDAVPA